MASFSRIPVALAIAVTLGLTACGGGSEPAIEADASAPAEPATDSSGGEPAPEADEAGEPDQNHNDQEEDNMAGDSEAPTGPADDAGADPADDAGADPADDADGAERHVGLTAEESEALAQADGVAWRIASVDGDPRMLTADLDPTRVTVEIEEGVVVRATLG